MASLKRVIWYVGESKDGLTTREIAKKINPNDLDKEITRVHSLLYRYKFFFSSTPVSRNLNTGRRYVLGKNGIRFYEKLLLTYDPITDTQILPQNARLYKKEEQWANFMNM